MREADEFGLLAERYVGPLVLKPNQARGLEARYADANEFIEEDATVRVSSAFWHEFKAMLGLRHHLCGIIIPHVIVATVCARKARRNVGSSLDGNAVNSGRISGWFIRIASAVADGNAPANASNGVKADQKALI
jgi:hypothetical protein